MLEDATENGYSAGVEKDASAVDIAMLPPKHTPGPWRIAYEPDCFPRATERELEICCLPHSTYDALDIFAPATGEDGRYAEPTLAEFDATARLIAAAPDLLLCLAWLLDIEGQNDRETREEQRPLALAAARAAIAKATSPQMEEG